MKFNSPINLTLLLFSLLLTFTTTSYANNEKAAEQNLALTEVLAFYDLDNKQLESLKYILEKTTNKNCNELFRKKANNERELLELIFNFIETVQQNLIIRKGAQERWEVQPPAWVRKNQDQLLTAFGSLNLLEARIPDKVKTDALCILGASNSIMKNRIKYAQHLFDTGLLAPKQLILLAGERYANYNQNGIYVDGSWPELGEISRKIGKSIYSLTETDLMRYSYENSGLYNKLPTTIIDTPRRNLPRPTTETTIQELLVWTKQHPEIKNICFISNQPHIDYQTAIIQRIFENKDAKIEFTVLGSTFDNTIAKTTEKQILYLAGALGSQLLAKTPRVIQKLQLEVNTDQLLDRYVSLFKRNPLIYEPPAFEKPQVNLVNNSNKPEK